MNEDKLGLWLDEFLVSYTGGISSFICFCMPLMVVKTSLCSFRYSMCDHAFYYKKDNLLTVGVAVLPILCPYLW